MVNHKKSILLPTPEPGILGIQHQLPTDANITTLGEDEENPTGFQLIVGSAFSISLTDSLVCGQDYRYPSSPATALQSTAIPDELSCSSGLYPG